MTTFLLIPGAGGAAWYWHRLVPALHARGHQAIAVDLPAADETAGLEAYTRVCLEALGDDAKDLVVVAQSMGGLTGPLVCEERPARLLVLLNAMIPKPGESGGDWWQTTGHDELGMADNFDAERVFLHDLPPDVAEDARRRPTRQSGRPFADPWPLPRWPAVPTRVLAGRDDRFFPLDFQRRIAKERLGLDVDVIPGGHLVALSQPVALADWLHAAASVPDRG